jgi:hypothetical protein
VSSERTVSATPRSRASTSPSRAGVSPAAQARRGAEDSVVGQQRHDHGVGQPQLLEDAPDRRAVPVGYGKTQLTCISAAVAPPRLARCRDAIRAILECASASSGTSERPGVWSLWVKRVDSGEVGVERRSLRIGRDMAADHRTSTCKSSRHMTRPRALLAEKRMEEVVALFPPRDGHLPPRGGSRRCRGTSRAATPRRARAS